MGYNARYDNTYNEPGALVRYSVASTQPLSAERQHGDMVPEPLLLEAFATLLHYTPVAVAFLEGERLWILEANTLFYGLVPAALRAINAHRRDLADVLPGCEAAGLCALARETSRSGQTLHRDALRIDMGADQPALWDVTLAPIGGNGGPKIIMLQIRQSLALVAATGEDTASPVEEFEQIKDDFLAITAHELRTPVTALLGYTNLMVRRAEGGDWTDRDLHALRMIQAQAQRLTQLINGLVDISRIQTGALELRKQPVDLNVLARQVTANLRSSIGDHTIQIETPDRAVMVWGDAQRLEQALAHLVDNALKYSPWGGAIQVRIWTDTEAHVVVSDRGIGIPEEAIPQLFQRFYRAANVDSDRISGLGIGLYLVKEFVTAHDGRIDVASQPDEGTTFEVVLPLQNAPEIAADV